MRLSVLVLTVPSRLVQCGALLTDLTAQAAGKPVEVLSLFDNKRRSVGAKRNALLSMARGDYIAFVDDDDWLAANYVDQLLAATAGDPELIVFDHMVTQPGQQPKLARYSVKYHTVETATTYQGHPAHTHCWRRDLALQASFPDLTFAEDSSWRGQLVGLVRDEKRIDQVLYYYRFDPSKSETRG